MKNNNTLFRNEEEVLARANHVLDQFQEQKTPLIKEYERLAKDYKKLLKHTKLLVKMSDQQQNQLTSQKEGLQSSNIELQLKAEEAEEAVRSSEKKLAQFLEAIPVGVFVVDSNGKPYYANQKAQQILSKSIDESVTIAELTELYQAYLAGTNQNYPEERQPITLALKGQISSIDDIEIHQQNGKVIPIEVWGTPIFDDQGNIAYAIAVFQDITERKRAEEERLRITEELKKLNIAYERFVPRQFLSLLDKKSVIDVKLGDQIEKEMTLLFADIRKFTSFSEKMTPQQNFNFLNHYLSRMTPIIHQYHGFIDKYIGDAIMALFSTSADDALRAAIGMLKSLADYNEQKQNTLIPCFEIGIGLHTGYLMLGTVGDQNRMDGTVISDAVNLASRIEGMTKMYGIALLISEQTYCHLVNASEYAIRPIDRVKVKGKSQAVTVYEVFESDTPKIKELKKKTLADFEMGLTLYHQQKFTQAQQYFKRMLHVYAYDAAAQIYLERCNNYQKNGVPDDWEGIEILDSKC
jgi:adenylate cyclase